MYKSQTQLFVSKQRITLTLAPCFNLSHSLANLIQWKKGKKLKDSLKYKISCASFGMRS